MEKKSLLFRVALLIFVFLLIISSVMILQEYIRGQIEQSKFDDLYDQFESSAGSNEEMKSSLSQEELDQRQLKTMQNLYEQNHDLACWIDIPETNIHYPVMLTPNEPEYYLRRSFDKKSSMSGTPFIGQNGRLDSDCFIIYGHNMNNDSMFGTLEKYQDEEFFKHVPMFSLYTLNEKRKYQVFAAIKTDIHNEVQTDYPYDYFSGDLSKEDFLDLLHWLKAHSLYETNLQPNYKEQILLVSTCSYHKEDGRFLIAARLIK